MKALRRFVCAVFGHAPARHVEPRVCLVFHCERCSRLVPGGLAPRERRGGR